MSLKVIVIGEAALDIFVYCDAVKINPEAPSLVVQPKNMVITPGMAENVVSNLKSLGLRDDEIRFICPPEAITKRRFVDASSNYILLRIDENDDTIVKNNYQFSEHDYEVLEKLIVNSGELKVVMFSNYGKGYLNEEWMSKITNLCNNHGIVVVADVKQKLGEWSKGIDFVKINSSEYKYNCDGGAIPENFCKNLLTTMGKDGVRWVNKGLTFKGKPVQVRDSVGAGDSFAAAFIVQYIQTNGNITDSIKFANAAGRIAVSQRGTISVRKDEIAPNWRED